MSSALRTRYRADLEQRGYQADPGQAPALEALEAKGVVSALRSRNGETTYEWAPERPAHHHLICAVCGAVTELDLDALEPLAAEIETRTGFQPDIRHLAIDGVCEGCREDAREATPHAP